jgi:predicted nucleic acid-binding protein
LLRPSAQIRFLAWIRTGGVRVEDLQTGDLASIEQLVSRYTNLPMDFADATLVSLAQETGIDEIITFDSRGFGAFRFRGKRRFVSLLRLSRARLRRRLRRV